MAGGRTTFPSEWTRAGFKTHIEVHIKPRIGSVPLQRITPLLLDEFYRELLEEGRADGRGTTLDRVGTNLMRA